MKSEEIIRICDVVTSQLRKVYHFNGSNPGIYVFDPENPGQKALETLETLGVNKSELAGYISGFRDGSRDGSCMYTKGVCGFDYVILLPAGTASEGEMHAKMGHEIMHGEHATKHCRNVGYRKYVEKFLGVAREFIADSGKYCVVKRTCEMTGKGLTADLNPMRMDYDETTDTFNFDIEHMVGDALAMRTVGKETGWKRAMFHAADQKSMFGIYNEVIARPGLKIMVPPSVDNPHDLREHVTCYLKSTGLKFRLELVTDEYDARGEKSATVSSQAAS